VCPIDVVLSKHSSVAFPAQSQKSTRTRLLVV
jgi:hypothetical protein